ncbi:MAG: DUF3473 domain-containing protein [Candidatus Solibacter usitatus]|nr:DUF3473 domain-containing protein [Candidatus Solibacter usitatus]
MRNILSVDVEDYFHPSEVQIGAQRSVDISAWDRLPSRVEFSTSIVLDLLAAHDTQATFFVLGWVAQRFPALVRRIAAAGHEIACHSYSHRLVYSLSPAEFRADTLRAVAAIQDACGLTPTAYRAPSYSIVQSSLWALDILAELGFTADSSIYPIRHDRYGIPGHPRGPHRLHTPSGPILEVPPATVRLSPSRTIPVGGGGYLRLLPYRFSAAGIRTINRDDSFPACIYFHPWELDPAQPRLASSPISRLRTYLGLASMPRKLHRLLSDFQFSTLSAALAGFHE